MYPSFQTHNWSDSSEHRTGLLTIVNDKSLHTHSLCFNLTADRFVPSLPSPPLFSTIMLTTDPQIQDILQLRLLHRDIFYPPSRNRHSHSDPSNKKIKDGMKGIAFSTHFHHPGLYTHLSSSLGLVVVYGAETDEVVMYLHLG